MRPGSVVDRANPEGVSTDLNAWEGTAATSAIGLGSILVIALVLGPQAAFAGDKEEVRSAIKKLATFESYAWVVTPDNAGESTEKFTSGPYEGKIAKEGILSATIKTDPPLEVWAKSGRVVLKTSEGWTSLEELSQGRVRQGPVLAAARAFKNHKLPPTEAEELLKKTKSLQASGDGYYVAELTDDSSKEQIRHAIRTSGQAPEILTPKGRLSFLIRDGVLVRYETHFEGRLSYSKAEQNWTINRTVTVAMTGFGTTSVEVPEEARKKLE